MWCEGYIELDLGVREQVDQPDTLRNTVSPPCQSDVTPTLQRVVAEILIVLSVKEPGENWQVRTVTESLDSFIIAPIVIREKRTTAMCSSCP
jgi:hypothetical protein